MGVSNGEVGWGWVGGGTQVNGEIKVATSDVDHRTAMAVCHRPYCFVPFV